MLPLIPKGGLKNENFFRFPYKKCVFLKESACIIVIPKVFLLSYDMCINCIVVNSAKLVKFIAAYQHCGHDTTEVSIL